LTTPSTARRPVSILDVARRAGVSASTVSRSLRGAHNVSEVTRHRVLQAAQELAYVPSPAASRLVTGLTRTIGVLVPFASRWFFSEVVSGAESALRVGGYDMLLYNIGDRASRRHFFESLPLRRRVDAVLTVASSFNEAEQAALTGLGLPLTMIGGRATGFHRVGIDEESSAATAVRHLVRLGHREVAMITGDPDDPVGRATTRARRAGFRRALREAGIEEHEQQIVSEPWGISGGVRAMEHLLSRARLPTAVFAESDEMAFGALQTLRRSGLAVPRHVSVIGFDDHEMASAADLTTIAQPVYRQGEFAARMLVDVLAGQNSAATDIVLPTRLVVRGSTGPVSEDRP
jgi:LacI family repressor for deo operon, udp, cdd, tsx, nupC, and nupG